MNRKSPAFKNDGEAEELLDNDLSSCTSADYLALFPFECRPKRRSVKLRIFVQSLNAVRAGAHRRGIPHQRYTRRAPETPLELCEGRPRQRPGRRCSGLALL